MTANLFTIKKSKSLLKLAIWTCSLLICLMMGIYVISFFLGPPAINNDQNTIYYDLNGEMIGDEKGDQNRHWVDIEDMSPEIIDAAIAIEDKNFFDHHGFDFKRIIGAAAYNLKSLSLKEGASTLSQQYARNLFLTHEKTWTRKLKEVFYTVRLEMYYSKEEILEGYLNTIYFGHGAYGIEKASKYFFNKHADEVSLPEAAMLIGIPKGPTYYSPLNDLVKATERQQIILKQMFEQQYISRLDYEQSLVDALTYAKVDKQQSKKVSPYFQDVALKEAAEILQLDQDVIKSGGYQIHTTLLPDLQKKLESNISKQINPKSDLEVGALAIHPGTGAIHALVGGRAYDQSTFNRAISAKRMTGSTFKPFLYYAALHNGYTASTKLMSEPTVFHLDNDETYQPNNFNGYYADDPITLAQSLALSDNIYAVKTNLFLGADVLVDTAKLFGITSDLSAVPSLALGTASVSVKEMTAAYGMLANGGRELDGYVIDQIIDRNGNVVFSKKMTSGKQILDPVNAFLMTDLMMGMFDETLNGYMAVTGSSISDQLTRPYAGKSGTTDSDSWMIGYSPSLVTGIWTGYDDNRQMESAPEVALAKNIWASFMEEAHQDLPSADFNVPTGVTLMQVDPATGQLATPYCPVSRPTYFKKGTEPVAHCQTHLPANEKNTKPDLVNDEDGLLKRLFDIIR